MYKVSKEYTQTIYSDVSRNDVKLTINGVTIAPEKISKIVVSSPIIDTTNKVFYLGTFISQKVTITFRNTENIELKGDVYLEIGTWTGSQYEYVPIGYFIIDTPTQDFYTKSELVCMDKAVLFKPNVDYSSALVDGKITIENLLKWLCEHFEVELGSYPDVPNLQKTISSYDSTISGKTYVSWIAELLGGNAKIDRDGKLCIVPLKSEPVMTINALKGKTWKTTEKYHISKVKFDNGILYKECGEDIDSSSTYNTLVLRNDNTFIQEEDFESRVDNIYDTVKDFEVWSLECENKGDPSLDCWDIVTYKVGDEEYNTFYDNTLTYEMSLWSKIKTTIPTEQVQQTTNYISSSEKEQIKRIQTIINQQEGKLEIIATQTDNNYKDLSNKFNDYVPDSEFNQYKEQMIQTIESNNAKFVVTEQLSNGDVTVVNSGSTTIDINGITIDKQDSPTAGQYTPIGVTITDKATNSEIFFAGYDSEKGTTEVRVDHINVNNYVKVGTSKIQPANYKNSNFAMNGMGIYWVFKEE